MRILGHYFAFPILIRKTHTFYSAAPNLTIRWDKSGMSGTMKTTSYTLEITTKYNKYQWSFVWRPDVTRYYWRTEKT